MLPGPVFLAARPASKAASHAPEYTKLAGYLKPDYQRVAHVLLIVVVALLAYANTFTVPFQFDDYPIIKNNLLVQDICNLADPSRAKGTHLYYYLKLRYVSLLSFAINYQLHGLDVVGYHVANLAIHIINALLVYLLLVFTFATPVLENSHLKARAPLIALSAALLFVAHPVQTQAVTYIVQRYMSLATLFYLLSLVTYIKWRLVSLQISRLNMKGFRSIQVGIYLFSLAAAILGMKAKEIVFTLPLAIALYEFLFFQEKLRRRVLFLMPFFLTMLVIPWAFIDLVDLHQPLEEIFTSVSKKSFIATPVSRWDYLLTQFAVIVTYLRLLAFPVNQNVDYDYPIYQSFFDLQVFLSFFFLLSLFSLAVYLIYRYRDQAPATRLIAFGIFWFFLTLAVESSFMPMIDAINEHRLYLPSVGAFMSFTTAAFFLADRWKNQRPLAAKLIFPALLVSVIIFTGATYKRNQVWQSEVSLWQDAVRKSPNKPRPYNELGVAYARQGRFAEAIPLYQKALRLDPSFAQAYGNLGVAYGNLGRSDEAEAIFLKALRINPRDGNAFNNLGVLYLRQKKLKEARKMFLKALEIHPGKTAARENLRLLQEPRKSPPNRGSSG